MGLTGKMCDTGWAAAKTFYVGFPVRPAVVSVLDVVAVCLKTIELANRAGKIFFFGHKNVNRPNLTATKDIFIKRMP